MEKIKITNTSQFEKLVEELEKNPSLARGFRRGTVPNDFKEQWQNIATSLNSLGPPIRTSDGWQKIWRDLKFKVKRKMVTNKAECRATGGGVFKQLLLSPLEESVANLLQFQKQINPEGVVQGVPNILCNLPEIENSVDFLEMSFLEVVPTSSCTDAALPTFIEPSASTAPSTSKTSKSSKVKTNSTPKKNISVGQRQELLEKHSSKQAKILTEISNAITSIKRSLRDVKDIEAKRLKLEVERSKREEEMFLADMKIKQIEFSIKEKELELLNDK